MKQDTVVARTFETMALLRCLGCSLVDAQMGETGRVEAVFSNQDGLASRALNQHFLGGVTLNSAAWVDALRWAKSLTYLVRDRVAGREGGTGKGGLS